MKILIADKLSEKTVKALQDLGGVVTMNPELNADNLAAAIGDAEILIVRSTKVKADVINAAENLSLIIRAGAGVNTIDLASASRCGIHVANCPEKNSDAVAELAIGLLIAADRRILNATADLRAGKWRKKEYSKAKGLKGRTLGILGLGSIGKAVARRAAGLEMNVIAWSRSLTPEKAKELDIGFCATPEELLEKSDAVSIHLAATPETTHFINKKRLDKMKDGAILINTSRGDTVDTAAMKEAIRKKSLRVGLDVFENEPAGGEAVMTDTEIAEMSVATPHIGASTDQASEAIAEEVTRIVSAYRATGNPCNTVNVRTESPAKCNLVVRYYNRVGVLAGILDEIRKKEINVEEIANTIFSGGEAASCTIRLDARPSEEILAEIRKKDNIIQVMLK